MRLIPGKTKVRMELFKGISLTDIAVAGVAMGLMLLIFVSNLEGKLYFCIGVVFLAALLLVRFDTEPSYIYLIRILKHLGYKRNYEKTSSLGDSKAEFDDIFQDEENEKMSSSAKERKKQEKLLYKQEKKILSSRTATKEEKDNVWKARAERSAQRKTEKKKEKFDNTKYEYMDNIMAFTDIKDGYIEYGGDYFGVAIEIPPVEFRFFSQMRRNNSIENGVGRILRSINPDFCANIVKIERPILFDDYIKREKSKLEEIQQSYINGLLNEEELKARCDMIYQRIDQLNTLCYDDKVIEPFYYIVLFDSNKKQLDITVQGALDNLLGGELSPKRLNDKELAIFLKYSNEIDFDEREIENISPEYYAQWAMPKTVAIKPRTTEINNIITHNMRVVNYPGMVNDGWIASLMSIPATKIVIKCKPLDHQKSITAIDRSIQEIQERLNHTGIESRIIELSAHAESLSSLLLTLQGDNETLLSVNIYVSCYDIHQTRTSPMPVQPPKSLRSSITTMKKTVRRMFSEEKFRLENMEFNQMAGFIGSQISGYDPMTKDGRGMPSNSLAAAYPWVYANIFDKNGVNLGVHDGVPVFLDFFQRNNERVNSNMVIVGKSGSGKSYATKSILSNLAADDTKIFILDPENEYSELAHNLHGKIINVGNASQGRLNPFQIITALDDETEDAESSSYATHLQFLEEFFKQSLVDCEKDSLEYLNALIDRTYMKKGINSQTNLSRLKPEDYPIFDDLYDTILAEFQTTENEYIRSMLRVLMNYISKYSTGGRNANIWNGPSSITTEENFTVFNFQSLLANRNTIIANSQMLLVLKYIDNEIIKNREYNRKYNTQRKIVVVIDEAHVFIDTKFPVALDFMFQLAKRIRKYNGMQIVITQNIKDFVGSEEIARKSTAIINACQYSFIFSLSPNDMDDLCRLYEKSGGINENEQEQIVSAPRGQAFVILSSQRRSTFKVKVPDEMVQMFKNPDYHSDRFEGEEGNALWEEYMFDARIEREANLAKKDVPQDETETVVTKKNAVVFEEVSEEEYEKQDALRIKQLAEIEAEREALEEAKAKFMANVKAKAKQSTDLLYSSFDSEADDEDLDELLSKIQEEVLLDEQEEATKESEPLTEDAVDEFDEDAFAFLFDDSDDIDSDIPTEEASADTFGEELVSAAAYSLPESEQVMASAEKEYPETHEAFRYTVVDDKPHDKVNGSNEAASALGLESVLEKLTSVMENMQKLSYESIIAEVQRMIAQTPAAGAATSLSDDTADNSEESFDDLLSSLFSSAKADISDISVSDESEAEAEQAGDDDDDDFDILSFLAEEADEEPEFTAIDEFINNDAPIVSISLEELIRYNLSIRKG